MYELDKRQPKYETLEMFARIFDTNIEYLLGRTSSRARIPDNMIAIPDDENPHILKICEIMEKADVDTQINICRQADVIAQGLSPDQLTESERILLTAFRQIPEDQQRVFLEMGRVYANSLKKD